MSSRRPRFPVLALLSLLACCDSRAGDDYRGSSLLHLEGRVIIADPEAGDDLIPALAFPGSDGIEFVNVDVRGDFPNNFSIDVYAPPPASAIFGHDENPYIPAGTRLAIAYITAMPSGHPERMVLAKEVYSVPNNELPACARTPSCDHVERWCLDELQMDCRLVGLPVCDGDCLPVLSEGNASIQLNDDTPGSFAGLSERHVLLWTRDGLAQSSLFSHLMDIREDLPAGYSLIALGTPLVHKLDSGCTRDPDSDTITCDDSLDPIAEAPRAADDCLGEECAEQFREEALVRYNERHSTHFADLDSLNSADISNTRLERVLDEVYMLSLELAIERGVDIAESPGTTVIHDPHSKLTVRISPDVEPLF